MEQKIFAEWLLKAKTFQEVTLERPERIFWSAYEKGLTHYCHPQKTEDAQDYVHFMAIAPADLDLERRAAGEGYRAGVAGLDPVELFHARKDTLTSPQLAEATGKQAARIRLLAPTIPGGRKTKHGWEFPRSAIAYIKALPGPGWKKGRKRSLHFIKLRGELESMGEYLADLLSSGDTDGRRYWVTVHGDGCRCSASCLQADYRSRTVVVEGQGLASPVWQGTWGAAIDLVSKIFDEIGMGNGFSPSELQNILRKTLVEGGRS